MKKNFLLVITIVFFFGNVSALFNKHEHIINEAQLIRCCPDLAVVNINFRILERFSNFRANVMITGYVANLGDGDFVSSDGQQRILLYEIYKDESPSLVMEKEFSRLGIGDMIKIKYPKSWNSSFNSEGSFPPNYRVVIDYDENISMDGNPKNDDCKLNNNSKEWNSDWFNQYVSLF